MYVFKVLATNYKVKYSKDQTKKFMFLAQVTENLPESSVLDKPLKTLHIQGREIKCFWNPEC